MDLDVTIFFYNPNIHPKREYEIRKEENKKHATKFNIPFVDCDYDAASWHQRMAGLELEPERGMRCSACFDMRMEVTAMYAYEQNFQYFTTTNATSRWKDQIQVNLAGIRAARLYDNDDRVNDAKLAVVGGMSVTGGTLGTDSTGTSPLEFWVYNWQSDEMTRRKYEVSVSEKFYKQEYCGCSHSLRDSNVWRQQQGIPVVQIGGDTAGLGTRYFEDVDKDAEEESQDVVDQFFNDANAHFGNTDRIAKRNIKLQGVQKSQGAQTVVIDRMCGDDKSNTSVFNGRIKSSASTSLNNW